MQYAYNFARDIAQAALEGHPSRRQRKGGKGWELQDIATGAGEEEGESLLGSLSEKDQDKIEALRAEAIRRRQRQTSPWTWRCRACWRIPRPGASGS